MLYKKIHRQYVREFRMGRRFRYKGCRFEITGKPYIDFTFIWIAGCWELINTVSGRLWNKDRITWLD